MCRFFVLISTFLSVLFDQVPKRRMTWGGKLLQAALPTDADSETGFMEPFVKQRRIDLSAIVEQDGKPQCIILRLS